MFMSIGKFLTVNFVKNYLPTHWSSSGMPVADILQSSNLLLDCKSRVRDTRRQSIYCPNRTRALTLSDPCIDRSRAATAECVNALARNRGLLQWRVPDQVKVCCVLRLHALAHNLMRTMALAPELLGLGIAAPSVTSPTQVLFC